MQVGAVVAIPPHKPWQRRTIERLAASLYGRGAQNGIRTRRHKRQVNVVCISDTHCTKPELPRGDVLLHAGDLSRKGTFDEVQDQLDWINAQLHPHKIVIGGNHDIVLDDAALDRAVDAGRDAFPPGCKRRDDLQWGSVIYLENTSVTLDIAQHDRHLTIYGSPLTPQYGEWAFQYLPIRDVWQGKVPSNTDILVTHGPPKSHLDRNTGGGMVGCPHLLREVHRSRPQVHLFGHIHDSRGQECVHFDAATAAYENIMLLDGGIVMFLRLFVAILMRPFRGVGDSTLLVNAATIRGANNSESMPPIVTTV